MTVREVNIGDGRGRMWWGLFGGAVALYLATEVAVMRQRGLAGKPTSRLLSMAGHLA